MRLCITDEKNVRLLKFELCFEVFHLPPGCLPMKLFRDAEWNSNDLVLLNAKRLENVSFCKFTVLDDKSRVVNCMPHHSIRI